MMHNKTTQAAIASFIALSLAACSATVTRENADGAAVGSQAKPGVTAVVERGDTLFGIAAGHGLMVRDLAAWNGLSEPYTIYPGQRLKLYPARAESASKATAAGPGESRTASAAKPASTVAKPGAMAATKPATSAAVPGKPASTGVAKTGPGTAAPAKPIPVAPIDSGIRWRWPAEGELISRFVAGEPTKQGIGVAGKAGSAVRAAGDGTVVYSGSGLIGYGELVIIKHNDQWLSAYGHNRTRLVNEGQLVKGGQQIAEMGRSGAPREMLHFEVRYNGKPVDPLLYLPKR